MMHKNHLNTNLALGASAGIIAASFVTDVAEAGIVLTGFVGGAALGQIIGPDLDIKTSKPARMGGGEAITLIAILAAIIEVGFSPLSIIISLFLAMIIIAKNNTRSVSSSTLRNLSFANAIICIINMGVLLSASLSITAGLLLSIFAIILNLSTRHRKETHSIFMVLLLVFSSFLLYNEIGVVSVDYLNTLYIALIFGYSLGYLNHLFVDMLGKRGVALLYPLVKKEFGGWGLYETSNSQREKLIANIVCIIYALICVVFLVARYYN